MMTVATLMQVLPKLELPDKATKARLQECINKAEEKGLIVNLMDKLSYLEGYAGERSKGCRMYADRAPFSFEFVMLDANGARWFNGGLLYYEAGDQGFGSPQFSVRLVGTSEGWEIHT